MTGQERGGARVEALCHCGLCTFDQTNEARQLRAQLADRDAQIADLKASESALLLDRARWYRQAEAMRRAVTDLLDGNAELAQEMARGNVHNASRARQRVNKAIAALDQAQQQEQPDASG